MATSRSDRGPKIDLCLRCCHEVCWSRDEDGEWHATDPDGGEHRCVDVDAPGSQE